MEVHSRLPEGAADTLMQGQSSLEDLVAQLLNVLLELLQVTLWIATGPGEQCIVSLLTRCRRLLIPQALWFASWL
jgi:hypothetical protein